MKQSIGDFLLRRLQEAGIRHLFGVPGDYNLALQIVPGQKGLVSGEPSLLPVSYTHLTLPTICSV